MAEQSGVQPAPAVEAKAPVSGETFGRVLVKDRTGEAGAIIDALSQVPCTVDTIAGTASHIPDNLGRALVTSVFGETPPADPTLLKMRQSVEGKITSLTTALDKGRRDVLATEIQKIVLQVPSLAEFFSQLPPARQKEFLDSVIDSGIMQAQGRQKFVETAVITSESSQYKRKKEQVDAIAAKVRTAETQIKGLGASLSGKDIPKITAERQASERNITTLQDQLTRYQKRIDDIVHEQSRITTQLRGKLTGEELQKAVQSDPRYQELEDEKRRVNTGITGLETQISTASDKIADCDLVLQQSQQREALESQLTQLQKELHTGEIELGDARQQLLRTVSELSVSLDKILPEAAGEALKELQRRVNEADKVRLAGEAKKKEEEGKKEGDMLKQAEGAIMGAFGRRYVRIEPYYDWRGRPRERMRVDCDRLRADFGDMIAGGSGTFSEGVIADALNDPNVDQEVVDYINAHRAEFAPKLVERIKNQVYAEVTRDAIQHLQLDRGTINALSTSRDFRAAATEAITARREAREIAEQITGQRLDSRNAVERMWNKLPLGGLIGLLIMLFGGVGAILGGRRLVEGRT